MACGNYQPNRHSAAGLRVRCLGQCEPMCTVSQMQRLIKKIENVSFDFADPRTERMVSLTAADRKWMDDIVHTVEETWGRVSYKSPHIRA